AFAEAAGVVEDFGVPVGGPGLAGVAWDQEGGDADCEGSPAVWHLGLLGEGELIEEREALGCGGESAVAIAGDAVVAAGGALLGEGSGGGFLLGFDEAGCFEAAEGRVDGA